jgi:hypothetical protein
LGNRQIGSTIGGIAGGLGRMLPFDVDPITAAYAQQQQQLAPAGFFGNLLGQVGQPLGSALGGLLGNRQIGSTIGGIAGGLGRMLPFDVDPITAAYAQQQQQLAPAGFFGNLLGQVGGHAAESFLPRQWGAPVSNIATTIGRMLPFDVDPVTAAYAQQQQQLAPAGIFGSMLGGLAGGLGGGALGGLLGNRQLGHNIGNAIGGIAGGLLPFSAQPGLLAGGYPATAMM